MNKKGFTLIELLEVIVVLAIIALIATPMVLNTIEEARKGAANSSTYSYISEVKVKVTGLNMLKLAGHTGLESYSLILTSEILSDIFINNLSYILHEKYYIQAS